MAKDRVWKIPPSLLNGFLHNPNCRCVMHDPLRASGYQLDQLARSIAGLIRKHGESDTSLRGRTVHQLIVDDPMIIININYDHAGDRYGRLVREFLYLGELRRQKKNPHKEIFYTWIPDLTKDKNSPAGLPANKMVLRSIINCSNDQVTDSIRRCGELIESHQVSREDGEIVLDFLYVELGRRANAGSQQNQNLG